MEEHISIIENVYYFFLYFPGPGVDTGFPRTVVDGEGTDSLPQEERLHIFR